MLSLALCGECGTRALYKPRTFSKLSIQRSAKPWSRQESSSSTAVVADWPRLFLRPWRLPHLSAPWPSRLVVSRRSAGGARWPRHQRRRCHRRRPPRSRHPKPKPLPRAYFPMRCLAPVAEPALPRCAVLEPVCQRNGTAVPRTRVSASEIKEGVRCASPPVVGKRLGLGFLTRRWWQRSPNTNASSLAAQQQ